MTGREASIAFFDLDGTLLPPPASEQRFFFHLVRRGLVGARQLSAFAVFLLRRGPASGGDALRKNKAYLAGLDVALVAAEAERFVAIHLAPALRSEVVSRLAAHRAAGERIVLLTGSPRFIAHPLARALGAHAVIATLCATAQGRFLAAPPRRHPFGETKRRLAGAYAARRGVALAACAAYGDSRFDAALLSAVGRAVAVHPDRRLARLARERGWETIGASGDRSAIGLGRLFPSARWL